MLYGGVLMERGPARDVIERPAHPYTAALLACVPHRRNGRAPGGHRRVGAERRRLAARLPLRRAAAATRSAQCRTGRNRPHRDRRPLGPLRRAARRRRSRRNDRAHAPTPCGSADGRSAQRSPLERKLLAASGMSQIVLAARRACCKAGSRTARSTMSRSISRRAKSSGSSARAVAASRPSPRFCLGWSTPIADRSTVDGTAVFAPDRRATAGGATRHPDGVPGPIRIAQPAHDGARPLERRPAHPGRRCRARRSPTRCDVI